MRPNDMATPEQSLPESQAPVADIAGGVLGDCTKADLKKGYCKIDENYGGPLEFPGAPELSDAGGFLSRPNGWER